MLTLQDVVFERDLTPYLHVRLLGQDITGQATLLLADGVEYTDYLSDNI